MRRGSLLSLDKVKLSFGDDGLEEMATVGHCGVIYVPEMLNSAVSPGKLRSNALALPSKYISGVFVTIDCVFPLLVRSFVLRRDGKADCRAGRLFA